MTERDWQRVATAVRARRESLGLKREDMTASPSTVYKLETAGQDSYKSFSLRQVEADLGWEPGEIDRIADGSPVPMPSRDGELDALRQRVDELEALIRETLLGGRPAP